MTKGGDTYYFTDCICIDYGMQAVKHTRKTAVAHECSCTGLLNKPSWLLYACLPHVIFLFSLFERRFVIASMGARGWLCMRPLGLAC